MRRWPHPALSLLQSTSNHSMPQGNSAPAQQGVALCTRSCRKGLTVSETHPLYVRPARNHVSHCSMVNILCTSKQRHPWSPSAPESLLQQASTRNRYLPAACLEQIRAQGYKLDKIMLHRSSLGGAQLGGSCQAVSSSPGTIRNAERCCWPDNWSERLTTLLTCCV